MSRRLSTNQITLDLVLHFFSIVLNYNITETTKQNKRTWNTSKMFYLKKQPAILDWPIN